MRKNAKDLIVQGTPMSYVPATRQTLCSDGRVLSPSTYQDGRGQNSTGLNEMMLMLTSDCNMRCSYCYEARTSPVLAMPIDTACRAIDALAASCGHAVRGVHFFGGEPLLEYELLRSIVSYCELEGGSYRFQISTNGTLLNNAVIAYLLGKHFRTIVSWDGQRVSPHRQMSDACAPSGEAVYRRLGQAVRGMGERRLWVRITVLPTTESIVAVIKEALSLGICRFELKDVTHRAFPLDAANLMHMTGLYEELAAFYLKCYETGQPFFLCGRATGFSTLIHDLKKTRPRTGGCVCGVSKLTVTPQGEYIPCSRYDGTDCIIGSVAAGVSRERMSEMHARRVSPACSSCLALTVCGGPCHATIHAMGMDGPPDSPWCMLTRYRVSLAIWLRQELDRRGYVFLGEGY